MAMFHGRIRGNTRGGQDQFSWDEVKQDKHRENYLGHSVMVPTGRWAKLRDPTWYYGKPEDGEKLLTEQMLKQKEADARKEELRRVKEQEQEALAEALGYRPHGSTKAKMAKLTKEEFAEVTRRGGTDPDDDPDRIKGVGFGKLRAGLEIATGANATEISQIEGSGDLPERSSMSQPALPDAESKAHHKKSKKSKKEHKSKDHKKLSKHSKQARRDSSSDSENESRGPRPADPPSRSADPRSPLRNRSRSPIARRRHDSHERDRNDRRRSRSPVDHRHTHGHERSRHESRSPPRRRSRSRSPSRSRR